MSVDNERREDTRSASVLERFADWYHIPALLVVMVTMLAIRLQSYDNFIVDGEVYFSGNDAWYHLREVNYAVRNWPFTMPFDPWTNFPYGTSVGQFGTLYDQLVATAAIIVGLGSPSGDVIAKTLLVAPAVFGALTAIPAYVIGKRLAGRLAGLFAAVLLALLPGFFLQRTLVGVADHNGVEPLFQALAVAALLVAFAVAEREMPIWEVVAERDFDAVASSLKWSALAGVAVALYMWVWPPGVLLVAVVGLFALLKVSSDVVNGRSPEPTVFVVAVSMAVTALLMIVQIDEFGFSATQFSLAQPFMALVVGGGAVFLAWLARLFESRDVETKLFPVGVFGLVVVAMGVVAVALPNVWSVIATNFFRILGFSANAATRTIGEAQPYLSRNSLSVGSTTLTPAGRIILDYGFTLFTAIVAVAWMLAKPLIRRGEGRDYGYVVAGLAVVGAIFLVPAIPNGIGSAVGIDGQLVGLAVVSAVIVGAVLLADHRPEHLFVVVWAAFITSAAFTQIRFNYYLAVVVVVLNAYLLGEVLSFLDIRSGVDSVTDLERYQVVSLAMVVLLIAVPALVVPLNVGSASGGPGAQTSSAWQVGQSANPGEVLVWEPSLEWMQSNTPTEGNFGGESNEMAYYGEYEQTGDFEYPEGAYGVQSWWDYGHWITVEGERIPNANPFQEGADEAANFLLAPNESQAQNVLASQSTEGNETRYVMVDWQMVTPGAKFGAPAQFYDAQENFSGNEFYERTLYRVNSEGEYAGQSFALRDQRFYDSMMVRLYYYHGSSQDASPVVVDWENRSVPVQGGSVTIPANPAGNDTMVRTFDNMSAAEAYVEQDGSAQVGGVGPYPEEDVPALEHYRLVNTNPYEATQSGEFRNLVNRDAQAAQLPARTLLPGDSSWLKTFERVPGATVQGSGAPANTTVTASVEMRIPDSNSTFTYTQEAETDENGEFEMTLPYSTTGYENYGPDNGYTNVSVQATGPYTLSTPASINDSGYVVNSQANLTVAEGQVNGDQSGEIEVELERNAQPLELTSDGSSSDDAPNDGASESVAESTDGQSSVLAADPTLAGTSD